MGTWQPGPWEKWALGRQTPSGSDADAIGTVFDALGGQITPLALATQTPKVPALAIIYSARWPEWIEAAKDLKAAWLGTPMMGILEEDTIGVQHPQQALYCNLDDFLYTAVRGMELRARIDRLLVWKPLFKERDTDR